MVLRDDPFAPISKPGEGFDPGGHPVSIKPKPKKPKPPKDDEKEKPSGGGGGRSRRDPDIIPDFSLTQGGGDVDMSGQPVSRLPAPDLSSRGDIQFGSVIRTQQPSRREDVRPAGPPLPDSGQRFAGDVQVPRGFRSTAPQRETVSMFQDLPIPRKQAPTGLISAAQPFREDFKGITSREEAELFIIEKETPVRGKAIVPLRKGITFLEKVPKKVGVLRPFVEFGVGFASGIAGAAEAVLKPVQTVGSVTQMALFPVKTAKEIGKRARTKGTLFVAGEFVGFGKGFKVLGKGSTKIVKEIRDFEPIRLGKKGGFKGPTLPGKVRRPKTKAQRRKDTFQQSFDPNLKFLRDRGQFLKVTHPKVQGIKKITQRITPKGDLIVQQKPVRGPQLVTKFEKGGIEKSFQFQQKQSLKKLFPKGFGTQAKPKTKLPDIQAIKIKVGGQTVTTGFSKQKLLSKQLFQFSTGKKRTRFGSGKKFFGKEGQQVLPLTGKLKQTKPVFGSGKKFFGKVTQETLQVTKQKITSPKFELGVKKRISQQQPTPIFKGVRSGKSTKLLFQKLHSKAKAREQRTLTKEAKKTGVGAFQSLQIPKVKRFVGIFEPVVLKRISKRKQRTLRSKQRRRLAAERLKLPKQKQISEVKIDIIETTKPKQRKIAGDIIEPKTKANRRLSQDIKKITQPASKGRQRTSTSSILKQVTGVTTKISFEPVTTPIIGQITKPISPRPIIPKPKPPRQPRTKRPFDDITVPPPIPPPRPPPGRGFRGRGFPKPPKTKKPRIPKFDDIFMQPKKKKKKRKGFKLPSAVYNPSLVAVSRKIKGKRPDILTGLKIRPIT